MDHRVIPDPQHEDLIYITTFAAASGTARQSETQVRGRSLRRGGARTVSVGRQGASLCSRSFIPGQVVVHRRSDNQGQHHRNQHSADYSNPPRAAASANRLQWQTTAATSPPTVAKAVITIGRKRRRGCLQHGILAEKPARRNFWSASMSRIPFLATIPMTMIMPMKDEMLKVVRGRQQREQDTEVEKPTRMTGWPRAQRTFRIQKEHDKHQ